MAAKKAASKKKAPKSKKKGKKKAQAAAPAAAATTPKKKKAKKKAPKKAAAAPKKKAKKTKKAKAKAAAKKGQKTKAANHAKRSRAAKKAARTRAAAANTTPRSPAKAKPKKKAKKKKAKKASTAAATPKKKKKKAKKKKSGATTVSTSSKTTPKGAAKRTKGKKKVSSSTKYKDKKGEVWTVKRRFNANPIDGAMNFVVLAGGGLLGFEAADMLDRFIATRTPSGAKFPWYGTDAAHRQMERPDGMRILGMAGLGAAFFAGAVFARKRFVKTSYFMGGVAMGAFLKLGHSLLTGYVWPKLFSVEKGTERSWGNRMYPLEQDKLQTLAQKKIADDNKNAGDAVTKKDDSLTPPGQKDADGKGALPASYAYPTAEQVKAKDFTYGVGRPPSARAGRIERTERALPSPESRVTPDLRRQVSGYEDEPVARPATRSDLGRSGGVAERHGGGYVGCDDGECGRPGCPACGDDPNPNVQMPTDNAFPTGGGTDLSNQPCLDSTGAQGVTDTDGVCHSPDSLGPPAQRTPGGQRPPMMKRPPDDGGQPPAERGGGSLPGGGNVLIPRPKPPEERYSPPSESTTNPPVLHHPNIQIGGGRSGAVRPNVTSGTPSLDQILRGNFN